MVTIFHTVQVIQEMQKICRCNFEVLSGGDMTAKTSAIINWKKFPQMISDVYGKLMILICCYTVKSC